MPGMPASTSRHDSARDDAHHSVGWRAGPWAVIACALRDEAKAPPPAGWQILFVAPGRGVALALLCLQLVDELGGHRSDAGLALRRPVLRQLAEWPVLHGGPPAPGPVTWALGHRLEVVMTTVAFRRRIAVSRKLVARAGSRVVRPPSAITSSDVARQRDGLEGTRPRERPCGTPQWNMKHATASSTVPAGVGTIQDDRYGPSPSLRPPWSAARSIRFEVASRDERNSAMLVVARQPATGSSWTGSICNPHRDLRSE